MDDQKIDANSTPNIPSNLRKLNLKEFIPHLKKVITSSKFNLNIHNLDLHAYHYYRSSSEDKNENREKVLANMNQLQIMNKAYLKRLRRENDYLEEEEKTGLMYDLDNEFKVMKKLKFSIFFWMTFYTVATYNIFSKTGVTKTGKYFFLATLLIPAAYYSYKQIKEEDIKIQLILLKHSIGKTVTKIDPQFMSSFMYEYDYYLKHQNLA
jgi:hypothetical protein